MITSPDDLPADFGSLPEHMMPVRYFIGTYGDHRYLVPWGIRLEWWEWVELPGDDERKRSPPELVARMEGPWAGVYTFETPKFEPFK